MSVIVNRVGRARIGFVVAGVIVLLAGVAPHAFALKYAAPQYHVEVDPSIAAWQPGPLHVEPEEELNIVGADVMDEITLGWVKRFRQAYPLLSVTMEARASGTGGPALLEGRAHAAPVGRELYFASTRSTASLTGVNSPAAPPATSAESRRFFAHLFHTVQQRRRKFRGEFA